MIHTVVPVSTGVEVVQGVINMIDENIKTVVNETNLKESSKTPWLTKGLILKVVILLVLIVVGFETYLGIQYLNGNSNSFLTLPGFQDKPQEAADTTKMFLISDKNQLKIGEKVNVEVRLATLGRTIKSSIVVIKYDPNVLQIDRDTFFTKGDVFSANPLITNPLGLIRLSAATGSPVSGYTGVGTMGILQFSAKKSGSTEISIELGPNNSNTISLSGDENILGGVSNLKINIE